MNLTHHPPTMETQKAISQLSSRKTPGIDAIPAEVYTSAGPLLTQKLVDIFNLTRKVSYPRTSSIPPLYTFTNGKVTASPATIS